MTRAEESVQARRGTACENLRVLWRSWWKQQQCISRCSCVHCLLPHMGMFSLSLCPCVSRQDILNYFAQLPPWTLATARQYAHHADSRTHSRREHSSRPSHTWISDTYRTWREKKKDDLHWSCWLFWFSPFSKQHCKFLRWTELTGYWKAQGTYYRVIHIF